MTHQSRAQAACSVAERRAEEGGFTLLEMAFVTVVLIVGAMSFAVTVIATTTLSQQAQSRSTANTEMVSAIENFRQSATKDFEDIVKEMSRGVVTSKLGEKNGITIERHVVLDETKLTPRMDLNGDGDALDTDLAPEELLTAYLVMVVKWSDATGEHKKVWPTMLARGEVDPDFDREEQKAIVKEAELRRLEEQEKEVLERELYYYEQLKERELYYEQTYGETYEKTYELAYETEYANKFAGTEEWQLK